MADAISASALVEKLRKEGCTVKEVRDWRTHNRNHKGPWEPINGVMIHHTVTEGASHSVDLCYDGYSALPGPLCHGVISKDGTVYLVGNGRANHAGGGDPRVLERVREESYGVKPPTPTKGNANGIDGNAHFYGFECINLGNGRDPWPEKQLEAIARAAAAICRHYGWSAKSVIGHLEWSSDKIDPRGFAMASMRARVEVLLKKTPGAGSATTDVYEEALSMSAQKLKDAVWETDDLEAPPSASTSKTNKTWKASAYLKEIYERLLEIRADQKKQDDRLTTIEKKLGTTPTTTKKAENK